MKIVSENTDPNLNPTELQTQDEPIQNPPTENAPVMRACLCCGKWMTLQADSKQVYCSPECSQENRCCPVCGKYFETPAGYGEFCSQDCAESHPEFDPLFKENV